MISGKIKKGICQYSTVEILEALENSNDMILVKKAEEELLRRNLSENEINKAKDEYKVYKRNKQERKNKGLKINEFLICFLMPFNNNNSFYQYEDFTQNEIDRFEEYGFEKKIRQAGLARIYGIIFYCIFIPILISIINKIIKL